MSNGLYSGTVGGGGSSGSSSTEAFRNLIINGSMIVDQRNEGGLLVTTTNRDYYPCDRFFLRTFPSSTPAYNVQRVTVSDADNSITGQNFSIRVQATSNVNIGTTVGNLVGLAHFVEGVVSAPLQWGTSNGLSATLSFYIKTNVAGTHWVAFKNNSNTDSYVSTFNVPSVNTYTKITQTIPAPPANSVWFNDSNLGIRILFDACRGSTEATTNNTWISGDYIFPSGVGANSNMWGVSNNYIELTGVQLEAGTSASRFEYRPYTLEKKLCERYFEKSHPEGIPLSPKYTPRRLWFADGNTFFPSNVGGNSNDYTALYNKYGQNSWMYFYVPSVNVFARLYWNNITSSIVRQTWFSSSSNGGLTWSADSNASGIGIPYSGGATIPCNFFEVENLRFPQSAPGIAVYMMGSNSANQVPFTTTKRAIPTMTFYNPYSSNGNVATDTLYSSNLTVFTPNTTKFGVTSSESSLWNKNVYFNWTAHSDLDISININVFSVNLTNLDNYVKTANYYTSSYIADIFKYNYDMNTTSNTIAGVSCPVNGAIVDGSNDMLDNGNAIVFEGGVTSGGSAVVYGTSNSGANSGWYCGPTGYWPHLAFSYTGSNVSRTLTLRVAGNTGSDGAGLVTNSGYISYTTASGRYGEIVTNNNYGAGDPTICDTWFTIKHNSWNPSTTWIDGRKTSDSNDYNHYMTVSGSNFILGHALLSKYPTTTVTNTEAQNLISAWVQNMPSNIFS